jgi:uncharacterized membrane protein YecN with MAPEG domain
VHHDIGPYAGPIAVTLAYLGVYYAFQLHILRVKTRLRREYAARGEEFDRYFGGDREMLAADRIQLNTLEHMPPFLILLWLAAVFVSVEVSTWGGAVYLVTRLAYPLLIGRRLGRGIRSQVMLATMSSYAVLAFFSAALVWRML